MSTMMNQMHTPWGRSESACHIAPGISFHTTSSHGGFHLDTDRTAAFYRRFPEFKTFCGQPSWFEEDCDAAVVVLAFPHFFSDENVASALALLIALAASYPRYAYFLQAYDLEGARCSDCQTPLDEFGQCPKCRYDDLDRVPYGC